MTAVCVFDPFPREILDVQVVWKSYSVHECRAHPEGRNNCQPVPSVVPKAEWSLKPWSEVLPPLTPCQAAHAAGRGARAVNGISVGILTHEPVSFSDALATHEARGLFDIAPEVLIYVSRRDSDAGCI